MSSWNDLDMEEGMQEALQAPVNQETQLTSTEESEKRYGLKGDIYPMAPDLTSQKASLPKGL